MPNFLGFMSGVSNEAVYQSSQLLMEKLAVEAFEVAMVSSSVPS